MALITYSSLPWGWITARFFLAAGGLYLAGIGEEDEMSLCPGSPGLTSLHPFSDLVMYLSFPKAKGRVLPPHPTPWTRGLSEEL